MEPSRLGRQKIACLSSYWPPPTWNIHQQVKINYELRVDGTLWFKEYTVMTNFNHIESEHIREQIQGDFLLQLAVGDAYWMDIRRLNVSAHRTFLLPISF